MADRGQAALEAAARAGEVTAKKSAALKTEMALSALFKGGVLMLTLLGLFAGQSKMLSIQIN